MPGRLIEERLAQGRYRARFEFHHPAEGIALMAGPYRIEERRVRTAAGGEVRLRTYFHPEIADLASGYLDSVAAYLDLYSRRIGAYPFSEFSVVSSPTPTGFGLPTLTYLGIDVLRLPFIRATSLGHEVLHNWWGNGVYPDYARGNWSEGLTTFMADYAYRERESPQAAAAMRLAWLRDYAAMPPDEDTPWITSPRAATAPRRSSDITSRRCCSSCCATSSAKPRSTGVCAISGAATVFASPPGTICAAHSSVPRAGTSPHSSSNGCSAPGRRSCASPARKRQRSPAAGA